MIVVTYEVRDDDHVVSRFKREFNTTLEQYDFQRSENEHPFLSLVAVQGEFKDDPNSNGC